MKALEWWILSMPIAVGSGYCPCLPAACPTVLPFWHFDARIYFASRLHLVDSASGCAYYWQEAVETILHQSGSGAEAHHQSGGVSIVLITNLEV
jgi:hypothetical protein